LPVTKQHRRGQEPEVEAFEQSKEPPGLVKRDFLDRKTPLSWSVSSFIVLIRYPTIEQTRVNMSGSKTLDWSVSEKTIKSHSYGQQFHNINTWCVNGEIKMFTLMITFKEQNTKKPLVTLW
jgi:hypothetical protein